MSPKSSGSVQASRHGQKAERLLADLFAQHGWQVQQESHSDPHRGDLLVRKGKHAYIVEVKAASEGRQDRVVPLLSEAILRAQSSARSQPRVRPLAVVVVPDAPALLVEQVREFANLHAPDVAIGIVARNGAHEFIGQGLEALNSARAWVRGPGRRRVGRAPNLFSDLHQWMLKVLLAPELPEHLLNAPRGHYRNVSQLAAAANVSVMSAFRFVHQLRHEFFLDESSQVLRLVRREELFRRWQAHALRPVNEQPMRLLIPGDVNAQLAKLLKDQHACLALFAAADALKFGHVRGVPPYVHVERLDGRDEVRLKGVVPAVNGEAPDFILRQASAPQSVFRAAVRADGILVSDVLQVWLDVSGHPSRGKEQAQLIEGRLLKPIIKGGR